MLWETVCLFLPLTISDWLLSRTPLHLGAWRWTAVTVEIHYRALPLRYPGQLCPLLASCEIEIEKFYPGPGIEPGPLALPTSALPVCYLGSEHVLDVLQMPSKCLRKCKC